MGDYYNFWGGFELQKHLFELNYSYEPNDKLISQIHFYLLD